MAAAPATTDRWLQALAVLTAHLVVALVALVVIGGATRVMEAGLACPDWPLCYGSLLPGRRMNLQVFLEWFHRLDAFLVGVALLTLAVGTALARHRLPAWLPWASGLALALVVLQGVLGALTVRHLLAASTVTAHLGTALVLLLLLSGLHQGVESIQPRAITAPPLPRWWLPALLPAGLAVLAQCLLGGAMASRWAADLCLSAGAGCQWLLAHRLGAWPVLVALPLPALLALRLGPGHGRLRALLLAASALVPAQIGLGLASLRLQLQVPAVTITHQLLAALLVALLGAALGRSLLAATPPAPSAFQGAPS
ncbi:MAG: COX15/CtaA family protein [Cyanobacteriota bacterium]|nr:COX15/CtaA family protein [Cyanobacteriota bacterium]